MKLFEHILILLAFVVLTQNSAQARNNINYVTEDELSPGKLAIKLTSGDTSSRQKVNSIFKWVTGNIAYNTKTFRSGRYGTSNDYWLETEADDTSMILKPLNLRVAEKVLKRKTAVCDGYARLFKILCDSAGVRCDIITGFGKTNAGRINFNFRSNHKWNAVYLDTGWFLLDATWAAGYINYRDEFEWQYNPHYFLTPPEEFILDHYPEDPRWTLLNPLPVLKEYSETPFKTAGFSRNYITAFKPVKGTIEASIGDSILFEIETTHPKKRMWISDFTYTDTNSIFMLQCCGAILPLNTTQGNKISATYHITSGKPEWVYIIYDDEMIMRYKLNIRKDTDKQLTTK